MKINKIFALLLAAVMLLGILAGCRTVEPDTSGTGDPGESTGQTTTDITDSTADTTDTTEDTTDTTEDTADSTTDGTEETAGDETVADTETTEATHNATDETASDTGTTEPETTEPSLDNPQPGGCSHNAFSQWQWEEYTFRHSSGGTYTSHRKARTCSECGYKETDGTDHICQKGSDNHTVTTVKPGTCTTKATMRSTCKVCGWYVEYEGSKGKHTIKTETRHLTDYGTYTNELDVVVTQCTSCGTTDLSYIYGEGFSDNNHYRNTVVVNQGSAFASRSPSGTAFLTHPTWQTVIRDYKYDSEGYVKQFTVYWHDASGNRYSYIVDCTPEHLASWFAEYGLTGGSGYKYQLKISGSVIVPYKVSWTS